MRALHAGFALAACLAGALASPPALAGALTFRVVDSAGHPISDAVVTLRPLREASPRPRAASGLQVVQQNTAFRPFVSVVPVGSTVAFPNFDPFRHHVYSFSQPKRFELKLFARDQTRSVVFDHAGVVAIGCNIHDSMAAFIFVTDTVWTARSGANGLVRFGDTPGGQFVASVWHPYLRAPGGSVSRTMAASAADHADSFIISLRAPPMHKMDGY